MVFILNRWVGDVKNSAVITCPFFFKNFSVSTNFDIQFMRAAPDSRSCPSVLKLSCMIEVDLTAKLAFDGGVEGQLTGVFDG